MQKKEAAREGRQPFPPPAPLSGPFQKLSRDEKNEKAVEDVKQQIQDVIPERLEARDLMVHPEAEHQEGPNTPDHPDERLLAKIVRIERQVYVVEDERAV